MVLETVLYEKKGKVAVITLNRPEAMNSINRQLYSDAGHALELFNNDPELLVAMITGAGDRAFCTGSDLKSYASGEVDPLNPPEEYKKWGYAGIVQHYMNKPIIAAVNGYALGGGMEIALYCDLVVASEKARFGLPEIKYGYVPGGGGLLRLPRQIPVKLAMEAILTGEPFSAEKALEWGLINRVVPHEDVLNEAMALANKICENPALAVQISKEIVYKSLDVSLDYPPKAWEINQQLNEVVLKSGDGKAGAQAFAEKRKSEKK